MLSREQLFFYTLFDDAGSMKAQEAVVAAAKENGIDEVLVIGPGKLEIKEWVGEKARWNSKATPLPLEKARTVVREYSTCALILGKDGKTFSQALVAMEKFLQDNGFYKAWAICNEALDSKLQRPCHEFFNIDIVATLRRYKKNLEAPKQGEYPAWGIMLLE